MTNKYEGMAMGDLFVLRNEICYKQSKITEKTEELTKEYNKLEDELQCILSLIRQKENEEIEKDYQEYCNTNTCPGFRGVF